MEEFLTAKQMMNRYGIAGIQLDRLAEALVNNYADPNQIKRFQLAADKCHALNQLYFTVYKRTYE